jgi:Cyclophilin type peptidyl-prolyl cis-trans isomerase/CLD
MRVPSSLPYALLQGQLPLLLHSTLPVVPAAAIRRGNVATSSDSVSGEFFIALGAHDDTAGSCTVWGHVTLGMHVVERIVAAEYKEVRLGT